MKYSLIWSCLFLLLITNITSSRGQSPHDNFDIIPQPVNVKALHGKFNIQPESKIYIPSNNTEMKNLAGMLAAKISELVGYEIPVSEKASKKKGAIILKLDPDDTLGTEGYFLSVNNERIILRSSDEAGIFYGIQTLYQLLPTGISYLSKDISLSLSAVEITDKPRFKWRGMMLDVGRYFYPVPFVKKFIDYLAFHKMNTFHWHLTEDHGWRIEIKKYPRLTDIGAWRSATQITPGGRMDENLHGGYYTQEQIRDVVAYAKERYVTIVPEIEMPGHSLAALAAYPDLSCTGGPFEMPVRWGIREDIYCAGNEQTFTFLENVLTEVAELFPGPFIHIGGDEAPKKRWETCEKCQKRIKDEGLKDEHELQSYFIKRIEDFLLTKNKRIIGWDEILEGGLAPNAAVMSWRGIKGGITAAKQKHDVVMAPTSFMYFDYYQGDPTLEPVAIPHGAVLSLKKVYSYEPVPEEISPDEASHIIGVQGNIWSEFIHSPEKVEYMGFPRAAALAEVAWTAPNDKNWNDFKRRMETQYQRYNDLGINYARSAYNVWQKIDEDSTAGTAKITFETESYNPDIYYTLDGSTPTGNSPKYIKPFEVEKPVIIKAATFKKDKILSRVSTRYLNNMDN